MITALTLTLLLAQQPPLSGECLQNWTISESRTLRNGEHAAGGGVWTSEDHYRCVNGDTIYVSVGLGMGEALPGSGWYRWHSEGPFWAFIAPFPFDPGGIRLGVARVPVLSEFRVAADHDPTCRDTEGQVFNCTTGYRVYVNGTQFGPDIPVSALVDGVVTSPAMSIPSEGIYTLGFSAFNAQDEAFSGTITIDVYQGPPAPPTGVLVR